MGRIIAPSSLEQAPPRTFIIQAQKAGTEDIAGCRYKHGNLERMTDCLCLSAESRLIEVPAYLCVILSFLGWGLRKNYAQEDLNLRPSDPQSDTLSS